MPKRKPFVCKTCNRSFSMAAHLARHSRVHGRKRPTTKRRAAAKPVRALARLNSSFTGLVSSLQDSHRALVAERETLSTQIAAPDAALSAVSGNGALRSRRVTVREARNGRASKFGAGSLKDYVHLVLSESSTPLQVTEIVAGVVRAGLRSKNKMLKTTVGIALAEMPGVRRVRRGVYALK